jgi:threonine dehydratase
MTQTAKKKMITTFDPAVRVKEAYERIRPDIRRTPIESSEKLSHRTGARLNFKWENEQITGSFKFRGALNKLRSLLPRERRAGVVSASTGNHGLAISYASGLVGVDLILFLPETVAEVKRRKIEAMGINLRFFGDDCEKTEVHARGFAQESGRIYISPYNDFDIVAGQGTVGIEVLEDLSDVQDIIVPVGGGGLIAGIGAYAKSVNPSIRIVGVEPGTSAFMKASIEAGKLVAFSEKPTFADALAGGIEAGSITFPLCQEYVDEWVLVEEGTIVEAMDAIREAHGRIVEGAGAVALAGILADPGLFAGRSVVCVVSGGNIDLERFRAITK